MLQRISALEPRVEHAVREDVIGHLQGAQRLPCGKAVVLPQAVDDHGVEARGMGLEPGHEMRCQAIVAARRPERMHGQRERGEPGRGGVVERDDFHLVTERRHVDAALPDAFGRTARTRVDSR